MYDKARSLKYYYKQHKHTSSYLSFGSFPWCFLSFYVYGLQSHYSAKGRDAKGLCKFQYGNVPQLMFHVLYSNVSFLTTSSSAQCQGTGWPKFFLYGLLWITQTTWRGIIRVGMEFSTTHQRKCCVRSFNRKKKTNKDNGFICTIQSETLELLVPVPQVDLTVLAAKACDEERAYVLD